MTTQNKLEFLTQPLNRYIDHTLLKPDATHEDFQRLLEEAVKYNFASVCVSPYMALPAKEALKEYPDIKICTVVGFPLGNVPALFKAQEAQFFAEQGVDEIDFVLNVGLFKTGLLQNVVHEINAIGKICKDKGVSTKCIVETCYLTNEEKTSIYEILAKDENIDYIKTSTGFGSAGASVGDVMMWNARRQQEIAQREGDLLILHEELDREVPLKIKAAGGIRDLDTALLFIACGADRLGTSASVKIMEEFNVRQESVTEGEETS